MINIRNEEEKDFQEVEAITRKAFYNLYIPGAIEHYLVHVMRDHEDFIKELDLEHSFKKAIELGFDTIVIFGSPSNYVSRGFKSCKKYNICLENGIFPSAMMVKELKEGALDGRKWFYYDSPVMNIDEKLAEEYDNTLEKMEKNFYQHKKNFIY